MDKNDDGKFQLKNYKAKCKRTIFWFKRRRYENAYYSWN